MHGLSAAQQEVLRRLALGDELTVARTMIGGSTDHPVLDTRSSIAVRLAALASLDFNPRSVDTALAECYRAGLDTDDVLRIVSAITPVVGSVRSMAARGAIAASIASR